MLESVLFPIVSKINEYLSNYILIFLLVGVGLWYSIKTRFVQVRCFGEGMKKFFGEMNLRGGAQKSGMTSFQALATAIAAQVGTGNIVGASGAILTGGPGAIFWMWIIAFFGMATIYAEATLAQKTRIVEPDGNIKGGPVYYITTAFKGGFGKFLAGFFAVSIILALGFMGCMVQSNSIGSTMQTAFGIPSWIVGIVLVIICAIIFLGGVQRLAAVTEKLVPIMAGIFLLGGLVILCARIKYVPATFGMIFKYAFQPQAIVGGGIGGMEAARVLKLRGHNPIIHEKSDVLGGTFIPASAESYKGKLRELLEWYRLQMKKLNIEVKLNDEVKDVSVFGDAPVIVATGSTPRQLRRVPGYEKMVEACEFLTGTPVGDTVAVIGGGLTGSEIAYELALKGKNPIIVEMKDDLVSQKGVCLANSSYLREWFALNKVPVYLETSLREVRDGAIVCQKKDGENVEIACDSVISCAGYIPAPLADGKCRVYLVGDCEAVGNLRTVIWKAYEVAMKI